MFVKMIIEFIIYYRFQMKTNYCFEFLELFEIIKDYKYIPCGSFAGSLYDVRPFSDLQFLRCVDEITTVHKDELLDMIKKLNRQFTMTTISSAEGQITQYRFVCYQFSKRLTIVLRVDLINLDLWKNIAFQKSLDSLFYKYIQLEYKEIPGLLPIDEISISF